MSEPKHIWLGRDDIQPVGDDPNDPNAYRFGLDCRYTLTSGQEWDALMERLRKAHDGARNAVRAQTLADLLDYFEDSK